MTDTTALFLPAKILEASQVTQYTAEALSVIDVATATNTSGANQSLTVHLVEPGGTAGPSNLTISARAIAPGETYLCPELVGQVLIAGGEVSTLSTGGLVMRMTGRVMA